MLIKWIEILITALCCAAGERHYIHMLQLESYQLPGYQRWLNRNLERMLRRAVPVGVGFTLLKYLMPLILTPVMPSMPEQRTVVSACLTLGLFVITVGLLAWRDLKTPAKKPLVFTKRARRLYGAAALLSLAACALVEAITLPPYIVYAAVAYLVWAAEVVEEPIEKRINAGYFRAAKKKLEEREDLIKIGITGSYGSNGFLFNKQICRRLSS